MIRVKKAFTLIELIIVILITSSVYLLMFSNSNFLIKDKKSNFSFINLKEYLIKNYEFQKEISFVCIENDLQCFIQIDGKIDSSQKIENIFKIIPEVYEYNRDQIKIDFSQVVIDNSDFDVVFEFKIDKDFKSKDYILDTLEDRVYVFNSIFQEAQVYASLNEVSELFEKNILEVKDAF